MIELGKYQSLEVVKTAEFGLYLAESAQNKNDTILLPVKEVPAGTNFGDKLNVFIYKDSEDRIIATTAQVPVTIGKLAVLRVKEVSKIGAFLDWGLMKDLLLPYKEQSYRVKEGDYVLVTIYVDKSQRLCATTKVSHLFSNNTPYKKDDTVSGTIYKINEDYGAYVIVDYLFSAMIPNNEMFQTLHAGDTIQARVTKILPDGKLSLSVREKSHLQMETDSQLILTKLQASDGSLPFDDSSSPQDIKSEFNLSKNAFKRAIGKLYKEGAIIIADGSIRLK